jgi:hypothetical protein
MVVQRMPAVNRVVMMGLGDRLSGNDPIVIGNYDQGSNL